MENGNSSSKIYDITLYPFGGMAPFIFKDISPPINERDVDSKYTEFTQVVCIEFHSAEGERIVTTLPFLLTIREKKQ